MAVLYRLRRRLRSRWRSAIALAAAVAVMGGVVLTLAAGTVRTLTAPDRYSDSRGGPYDATLNQQSGRPRTAEVAALPAVADVASVTFVFGELVPVDADPHDAEGPGAIVFVGSPAAVGKRLVEGREPDPAAPGEFVAVRSIVDRLGVPLGAQFDLWVIPSGPAAERGFEAADEAARLLTATLVGVLDGPVESEEDGAPVVFPVSLLDEGDVAVSTSVGVVKLRPGADLDDLRSQLDSLPNGSQFGIDPAADWVPGAVRRAVSAQGEGLAIMTAIAAVAAVVVMGQVLSRQVRLAEPERLVLDAIGMRRRQVIGEPVLGAAVPVAVGLGAAVVISYLTSGWFPSGFVRHVEPDLGRRFNAFTVLSAALLLGVAMVAWVLVALMSTHRRARSHRSVLVDTVARRAPARAATGIRFAFARPARDAGGPLAAVVGMVAVLGVGVGALTFGASLGELVHRPIGWGENFDFGVGGQGGGEVPADAIATVQASPDVEAFALFGTVLTSVGAEGFDVTGLLPVLGSMAPPVFEGRLPQGVDEIAIGAVAARRYRVGVGDPLTLTGPGGTRTLKVTGVAVIPGIDGGDGVGEGGLVTFEALRLLDPEASATVGGIRLRPDAPPDAPQRLADALGLTGPGGFSRPEVIVNVARVRSIPYLVAAILGALALLNLVHQLVVSTHRRRRDITVLQALGADNRWVSSVVHWQVSVFTVFVMAVAAPLGILAGQLVYRAFVDRIGALDTVKLPVAFLVLMLVGLVALANGVATPNAYRARRLSAGMLSEDY